MRVLHVADLHLGRELAGLSRREEQQRLVGELVDAARQEGAELVVIAGDVYDGANPPAWAEDAFYGLLDGLAEGGRRAVLVLAGNHDNAVRLAAAEPLARRLGIWVAGGCDDVPGAFGGSGTIRIEPLGPGAAVVRSADGARAVAVGAVPFVSEVALLKRGAGQGAPSEVDDRDAYGRALAALFAGRKALLPPGMPHLLAGHLWVTGGAGSQSERTTRVGNLSDLGASALPDADYIALGHLHRPQRLGTAGTPIVYAGSPIAYSMSEAGQAKRAVLAELATGRPASIQELPLSAGRPLEEWTVASFGELRARAAAAGRQPIVALRLNLGRAVSRLELEELHELGPAFLDVRDLTAPDAAVPADGTGLVQELPDADIVRAYVAQEHSGDDVEVLVEELLALLGEGAQAAPEGA